MHLVVQAASKHSSCAAARAHYGKHHVMHHVMHPVMNHVMHHVLPRCTLAVLRLLLGSPELRAVRAAAAAAELTRPSFARLARGATHTIA